MTTRTEREFHIALTHLLDRVRALNSWSADSFKKAATHVANVKQSEAYRFQKAMLDMNYIVPGSNKTTLKPDFDPNYYKNTDACISFIKSILEVNPDIIQQCGPKKGFKRNQESVVEPVIEEPTEESVTIQDFTSEELVAELRNRGYVVTCAREVVTIETL